MLERWRNWWGAGNTERRKRKQWRRVIMLEKRCRGGRRNAGEEDDCTVSVWQTRGVWLQEQSNYCLLWRHTHTHTHTQHLESITLTCCLSFAALRAASDRLMLGRSCRRSSCSISITLKRDHGSTDIGPNNHRIKSSGAEKQTRCLETRLQKMNCSVFWKHVSKSYQIIKESSCWAALL